MGVDAVAFISMAATLALGQTLAGVVVAIMYAGGTVQSDAPNVTLSLLSINAPRVA